MDAREDLKEFLTSRRGRVSPADVGFPSGGSRRVPGLRRSELALVAGVSAEYYAKIERGALPGVSGEVLHAISTALRLDDAETKHLTNLVRALVPVRLVNTRRRPETFQVRDSLQSTLDAMTGAAAFIRNGRLDVLATNLLARAAFSEMFDTTEPGRPANLARFTFLHPDRAQRFCLNWDVAADNCVATLRAEAGARPHDKRFQDLIGELSTLSDEFRTRWGRHDVRRNGSGIKDMNHPLVGPLHLYYEAAQLSDGDLSLRIYSAPAGTASADSLAMLASWATKGVQQSAEAERLDQ